MLFFWRSLSVSVWFSFLHSAGHDVFDHCSTSKAECLAGYQGSVTYSEDSPWSPLSLALLLVVL